jgi:hypothetical protein
MQSDYCEYELCNGSRTLKRQYGMLMPEKKLIHVRLSQLIKQLFQNSNGRKQL